MSVRIGIAAPLHPGQRLLLVIPMIWVLLTLVFFLLRVAPGDPVSAALGGQLSEEALDAAPRRRSASTGRCRAVLRLPRPRSPASTSAPPSPTTARSSTSSATTAAPR